MGQRHADRRTHRGQHARASHHLDAVRARIAFEAARLISESGIRDYALAKRKAATLLGVDAESALPKNVEIEDALREHQRLFHGDDQPTRLRELRETAMEAMRFFATFEPRLVGAVLDGTADEHSAVCLHLFSDDPDAPMRHLDEHGIAYDSESRSLRFDKNGEANFPVLMFAANDIAIDVTIFPYDGLRQAPLDRIVGRPMQRANLAALRELLGDSENHPIRIRADLRR
ncbi:hypothetical protein [Rudaea sp.]|uniref:hypothetical protein n=1 Tax=Rudaea sp. TaxID=2136325 RepID=UPI002ED39ECB